MKHLCETFVAERLQFVFLLDVAPQGSHYLSGSHVFALVILRGFVGEEPLQRECAEGGFDVLTVGGSADSADVVARRLCHVLELHGSQQRLVAFLEEGLLQLHDGLHGSHHRLRALLEGVDEHLSSFHILTDEGILLPVCIGTDDERRLVAAREGDGNRSVLVRIHIEVGLDGLSAIGTLGSKRSSRPRIEPQNLAPELLGLSMIDVESLLNSRPTLVDEVVETLVQHLDEQVAIGISLVPSDLNEQAFLQRTRSDARRVELLKHLQHLSQLLRIRIEALINLSFVGKDGERFLQEAVLVERTDEVLHQLFLVVREVEIRHLLAQLVSQGERIVVGHELSRIVAVACPSQEVRNVVL